MIGSADFAEARGAHQLKEAQARFAIRRTFEILVRFGQDRVTGVSNGAIAFDVGVDQAV